MFSWMKMEEHIEFSSIFPLKTVAENIALGSLWYHFTLLRVKLNLFSLVEFCTSTTIFWTLHLNYYFLKSKIEVPQTKSLHTLDRANSVNKIFIKLTELKYSGFLSITYYLEHSRYVVQ